MSDPIEAPYVLTPETVHHSDDRIHVSASRVRLRMDPLVGLLDGPRARGAILLRCIMEPPWSLRVQDEAPLTLVAVVSGTAWVAPDQGADRQVEPGDVAILRGPGHYTVADHPDTPIQFVIHAGQRCTTADGAETSDEMDLAWRTWGNDPHGSTVMLVGTYQRENEIGKRLLRSLPGLVVLRNDDWYSSIVPLLDAEISNAEPGQQVMLDRLLDLLLVASLRGWFSRSDTQPPRWYQASSHPVVGPALRMLQTNPAQPWTVAALAREVGVSKATLARRFTELVGEPPMAYLTGWRLTLAADLLREDDSTIGAIASEVGYGSPFSLSTAFKRVWGISPTRYRSTVRDWIPIGDVEGPDGDSSAVDAQTLHDLPGM